LAGRTGSRRGSRDSSGSGGPLAKTSTSRHHLLKGDSPRGDAHRLRGERTARRCLHTLVREAVLPEVDCVENFGRGRRDNIGRRGPILGNFLEKIQIRVGVWPKCREWAEIPVVPGPPSTYYPGRPEVWAPEFSIRHTPAQPCTLYLGIRQSGRVGSRCASGGIKARITGHSLPPDPEMGALVGHKLAFSLNETAPRLQPPPLCTPRHGIFSGSTRGDPGEACPVAGLIT
jgi:hypothetical protein